MNQKFAILLILTLTATSLTAVKTAQAAIPKPSVPEFTLKYVVNSYDVPPTYGIDQYTGKTVIIQAGQHVEDRRLEFTIKNQPFTAYDDASDNHSTLYYNFRFKGPYGNVWTYYPDTSHSYGPYAGGFFPDTSASNSDYTVIIIDLCALTSYPAGTHGIPTGSQVEFQVQAIIGHIVTSENGWIAGDFFGFAGEKSDWSNTQMVTIGESAPDEAITPNTSTPNTYPSQNSTATPDQSTALPEQPQNSTPSTTNQSGSLNVDSSNLDWTQIATLTLLGVIAVLLAALIVVFHRRNTK